MTDQQPSENRDAELVWRGEVAKAQGEKVVSQEAHARYRELLSQILGACQEP